MFFPDDAVRVVELSEYVDRQARDRLLQRPPEETMTATTIGMLLSGSLGKSFHDRRTLDQSRSADRVQ